MLAFLNWFFFNCYHLFHGHLWADFATGSLRQQTGMRSVDFATVSKTSNSFVHKGFDPEWSRFHCWLYCEYVKGLAFSVMSRLSNPARDIHSVVREWRSKSANQQFCQGSCFIYHPCPCVGVLPIETRTPETLNKFWEYFSNSFGERCCCLSPSALVLYNSAKSLGVKLSM